jgi:hypothetical protein
MRALSDVFAVVLVLTGPTPAGSADRDLLRISNPGAGTAGDGRHRPGNDSDWPNEPPGGGGA